MAAPPAPPVTAAPVAPTVKAWPAAPRAGDYACSLQAGDHQYPTFRCRVYRAEDGSRVLEKMGGSQRFRGRIAPARRGFSFDGTFFCPSGDCTESVAAEFTAVGPGRYRGVMWGRSGPLGVSLEHMPGGFSDVGVTAAAAIAE